MPTAKETQAEQRLLIFKRGHGNKWSLKNSPGLQTADEFPEFNKKKLEDCDYKFLVFVQSLLAMPEWEGWRFKYWLRNAKHADRKWPELDHNTRRVVLERAANEAPGTMMGSDKKLGEIWTSTAGLITPSARRTASATKRAENVVDDTLLGMASAAAPAPPAYSPKAFFSRRTFTM